MDDDEDGDDEDERYNVFEDGHWIWNSEEHCLQFISHRIFIDDEDDTPPPISDDIQFRNEVDLLEQVLFKKKFYRKLKEGEADVIIIQDIKDVVLFTAPKGNLSFKLINTLHTCAYERFARSLVVYIQYYLQICQIMNKRRLDGAKKIRLPESDMKENILENNLADFRSIVAREFLYLHLDDSVKTKKRLNMLSVEMRYTEMLIRISVQIVWIALIRPDFDTIEAEINRILRSQLFNLTIHRQSTELPDLSIYEKAVIYREKEEGEVIRNKFNIMSPAAKDLFLYPQDYRHLGIGFIGYKRDSCAERIEYLDDIFFAPEESFENEIIRMGILGEPRSKYDIMLKEIAVVSKGSSSKSQLGSSRSTMSNKTSTSRKSKAIVIGTFDVPMICTSFILPESFPQIPAANTFRPVNKKQKIRWMLYILPKKGRARKSLLT